jgi:serine/threonine protein kinase
MEMLPGSTLATELRVGRRFSAAEVKSIAHQLLDGLSAIHAQGIVHRDFKPDNIFLVPETDHFRVVIADFGLASATTGVGPLGGSARLAGTLAYMAPEQRNGGPASASFDIYAFGIVMSQLLSGGKPRKHPGRSRRNGLPARWQRVLARCVAADPGERYASVEGIRDDLFPSEAPRRAGRSARPAIWLLVSAALSVTAASVVALRRPSMATTTPPASRGASRAAPRPLPRSWAESDEARPLATPPPPPARPAGGRSAPLWNKHLRPSVKRTESDNTDDRLYAPQFSSQQTTSPLGPDALPSPFVRPH